MIVTLEPLTDTPLPDTAGLSLSDTLAVYSSSAGVSGVSGSAGVSDAGDCEAAAVVTAEAPPEDVVAVVEAEPEGELSPLLLEEDEPPPEEDEEPLPLLPEAEPEEELPLLLPEEAVADAVLAVPFPATAPVLAVVVLLPVAEVEADVVVDLPDLAFAEAVVVPLTSSDAAADTIAACSVFSVVTAISGVLSVPVSDCPQPAERASIASADIMEIILRYFI